MLKKKGMNFVATIWECIGVLAILMLIVLPSKSTIIDMLVANMGLDQKRYSGISFATLLLVGIFLLVYLSSIKLFPKEKSTKVFTVVSSALMVATIVSLIVFR